MVHQATDDLTAQELLEKTERCLTVDLCKVLSDATKEVNFETDVHRARHDSEPLDIAMPVARARYAKMLLFDLWRGEPVLDVLANSINVPGR